jgi:Flp pilus assembly protein TadB
VGAERLGWIQTLCDAHYQEVKNKKPDENALQNLPMALDKTDESVKAGHAMAEAANKIKEDSEDDAR